MKAPGTRAPDTLEVRRLAPADIERRRVVERDLGRLKRVAREEVSRLGLEAVLVEEALHEQVDVASIDRRHRSPERERVDAVQLCRPAPEVLGVAAEIVEERAQTNTSPGSAVRTTRARPVRQRSAAATTPGATLRVPPARIPIAVAPEPATARSTAAATASVLPAGTTTTS